MLIIDEVGTAYQNIHFKHINVLITILNFHFDFYGAYTVRKLIDSVDLKAVYLTNTEL